MTQAPERLDQRLQDLIEVIQFTEDVSVKIHGLPDAAAILTAVVQESLRADKYAIAILLLDDDGRHLRALPVAACPRAEALRAKAEAAGVAPLTQFAVDVDQSALWQPVIREARTVQHPEADVVRASFPPAAADVILETTAAQSRSCILTPLRCQDNVIGALALASANLGADLLPFVRNLAQHITRALEAAEASAFRAQAEAALRESELSLRAVLNATSEAIFLADADGTILAANQALAARFGTSPEQLVGSNAFDILPPEVAAARRAIAARELPAGQPFRFEDRRDDRILDTTVYPICNAQGELERVAIFSHDVTEIRQLTEALQESEGRFRQMAEVMPAMFWMVTPDWKGIIFLSAAFDRILGFNREECYARPERWSDALHPDDRAAALAFWEEHHEQPAEYQHRIVRPDGEVRWVRDVSSPVRSESGELLMVVGFVEDITERMQAEGRARQAEKLSSLGLLAAGIAHGLRNPLGVISACAQMLLQYPNDKHLRTQCSRKINAATKRASQIIENLLRFARPQDVPMTSVDVPAVLRDALVLLADHLLLHKVALEEKFHRGLPAIRGNPQLLQQVFVDMVLNACSAMAAGGTLTVSASQPEPGWVEIGFQDTGGGIPPEHLPRLFDPFFSTTPGGVGLGLSVSYSIVRQHGGTIEVESEIGQGTTFTVRLPVPGEK